MKRLLVTSLLCLSSFSEAATRKVELVEETEKRETRRFCSKNSGRNAQKECQKWLSQQSKTLGKRLLTSYCSQGQSNKSINDCMYKSVGELKYVLKTYRTETVEK